MESINVLGPDPERHRAFTRDLLAETDDVTLQKLVKRAAEELSTPIALVTLVLDRIQFFKAHYGLPADLQAARGTDRDVSFCQFVVRDNKPFEVTDAPNDSRVPQHLVDHYGLRSYLGMPIHVGKCVVGSLCVIDTKARSFSDEERQALQKLADLVTQRVNELAEQRHHTRLALTEDISTPALAELRETLQPVRGNVAQAMQAMAAINSFLRLSAHTTKGGQSSARVLQRSLDVATQAAESIEDLLHDIEASSEDAEDGVLALEYLLSPSPETRLAEVLAAAQDIARRSTRAIGGAPLPDISPELAVAAPRPLAVALVAACLSQLAKALASLENPAGIRLDLAMQGDAVRLSFGARGLGPDILRKIASDLKERMANDPGIRIEAGESALNLTLSLPVR